MGVVDIGKRDHIRVGIATSRAKHESVVDGVDADGSAVDGDGGVASVVGEDEVGSGARGGTDGGEGAAAEHVVIDGAASDLDIGVAIHLACCSADLMCVVKVDATAAAVDVAAVHVEGALVDVVDTYGASADVDLCLFIYVAVGATAEHGAEHGSSADIDLGLFHEGEVGVFRTCLTTSGAIHLPVVKSRVVGAEQQAGEYVGGHADGAAADGDGSLSGSVGEDMLVVFYREGTH